MECSGVAYISFDGVRLKEDELKKGDEAVPNTEYQHCYRWIRKIPPEGALEVRSRYKLVKERSDTELWLSLIPGLSMDLTMHVSARGLEFGVKAIHRDIFSKIIILRSKIKADIDLTGISAVLCGLNIKAGVEILNSRFLRE